MRFMLLLYITPVVMFADAEYLTNGYLDEVIDWIPGMKNIRFRDYPSFVRTMDPNDKMLNYLLKEIERSISVGFRMRMLELCRYF